jgi:drug/metabolite transporter (DMT)-like permease
MQKADKTTEPRTDRLKAIGLIVLAVSFFSCLDATGKYLVGVVQLPVTQVVWMRFVGQFLVIIVALGAVSVPSLLATHKLGHQIARSVLLLGATLFNFVALRHLRLDQTVTIQFLAPLLVTLLAGPILGEWVGWRRLVAILVGFGGILVVVRPGFADIHPAVLFSLASMLSYALFILSTRYLAAHDRAANTLFYSLLAGTLFVAPLAILDWVWPANTSTWLLLLSLGFWGGAGHYVFILAHRWAPASSIAPFIYTQLLSSTVFGFALFGDVPDRWTLAGSAIIIASSIYLLYRERATSRGAQSPRS